MTVVRALGVIAASAGICTAIGCGLDAALGALAPD
jgi:hypothetical protein